MSFISLFSLLFLFSITSCKEVLLKTIPFNWESVYSGGEIPSILFTSGEENEPDSIKAVSRESGVNFHGSPYPTRRTTNMISKNNYILHVHSLDDSFKSGWSDVDDELLGGILNNVGWIIGGAGFLDKKLYFQGRQAFIVIGDRKIATTRHGVADYLCYDPEKDGVIRDTFNRVCENPHYKLPLIPSTVVISKSLESYNNWDVMMAYHMPIQSFTSNYVYSNIETSDSHDISLITTHFPFKRKFKFEPVDCNVGDDILIIGHPTRIIGAMATGDGIISAQDLLDKLYGGTLTVSRGKITSSFCNDESLSFRFDGIVWHGFSGGPIVLRSNPLKLCGMHSHNMGNIRNDHVMGNVGICSSHPLITDTCSAN